MKGFRFHFFSFNVGAKLSGLKKSVKNFFSTLLHLTAFKPFNIVKSLIRFTVHGRKNMKISLTAES
jgi:hypothetical protein